MLICEQKESTVFTHYLAGCLVFLLLSGWCDWHVTSLLLIAGSFCGALPDWLSLLWGHAKINKWSHKHRDNITHSLVFTVSAFILVGLFNIKLTTVFGLALLTHPILDCVGMGWGVKLFYPFCELTVKFGHIKGKWLYTQQEIDAEAEKYGDENWIRNIYNIPWCIKNGFRYPIVTFSEYGSLLLTVVVIITYMEV